MNGNPMQWMMNWKSLIIVKLQHKMRVGQIGTQFVKQFLMRYIILCFTLYADVLSTHSFFCSSSLHVYKPQRRVWKSLMLNCLATDRVGTALNIQFEIGTSLFWLYGQGQFLLKNWDYLTRHVRNSVIFSRSRDARLTNHVASRFPAWLWQFWWLAYNVDGS